MPGHPTRESTFNAVFTTAWKMHEKNIQSCQSLSKIPVSVKYVLVLNMFLMVFFFFWKKNQIYWAEGEGQDPILWQLRIKPVTFCYLGKYKNHCGNEKCNCRDNILRFFDVLVHFPLSLYNRNKSWYLS